MSSPDIKVAVLGASGLVGATFTEHLLSRSGYDVRPFIHSTGNAWRLFRRGDVEPRSVDVMDEDALTRALGDCTHVVNCTRGKPGAMIKGMKVLLKVCRAKRVERLVHLSSVAVYGIGASLDSTHEDATPAPDPGYGVAKFKQDEMVEKAARRGLSAAVLCIPAVSGRYAPFNAAIVDSIRNGSLALVDDGKLPLDTADSKNIAVALEKGMTCAKPDGKRVFITDGGEPDWSDLVKGLEPLTTGHPPLDSLSFDDAVSVTTGGGGGRIAAFKRAAGQLVKIQEVREIVKNDTTLRSEYAKMRTRYDQMPGWMRRRFDSMVMPNSNGGGGAAAPRPTYNTNLIGAQLRNVRRSQERAREQLGYEPAMSVQESLASYVKWYRAMYGIGGGDEFEDLYRKLG